MTDNELLQAISEIMDHKLASIKKDIQDIQLHIENITDKNIQLLAENHISLVDKLNQAIKVSDKISLYEIKVNYLTEKVDKLEKEMKELKNRIA